MYNELLRCQKRTEPQQMSVCTTIWRSSFVCFLRYGRGQTDNQRIAVEQRGCSTPGAVSTAMGDPSSAGITPRHLTKSPRPTPPPILSGTRNQYQPNVVMLFGWVVNTDNVSCTVCLSVCLSVRSHNSKTTWPIFTNFLWTLSVAMARTFCDGVAIC